MNTTPRTQSSAFDAAELRSDLHSVRALFASGALDDLPVAALCFERGALIDANREWEEISGFAPNDAGDRTWLDVVHPDDRDTALALSRAPDVTEGGELNLRIIGVGGTDRWFRAHVRSAADASDHTLRVLTLTSVGPHRSNEARLLHLSTHDSLTGLANRTSFVARVSRALQARSGEAGMLFIDLDHFKVVNDRLGHRFGNEVLRAVCQRIEKTLRSTELTGRLGGDEIGVFCPQIKSRHEVFALAERVGHALATPFRINTETVIIHASVGIAFADAEGVTTAERLIECADQAMYVAKSAGGGRWATLDESVVQPVRIDACDDSQLAAIRTAVDRAEEHTLTAWKHSTTEGDVERSARLAAIREALRRASLLIRAPLDIDIDVASTSEVDVNRGVGQMNSLLHDAVAVAQATGVIAQRAGCDATRAASTLHAFADARGLPVATAARALLDRTSDIDVVAAALEPPSAGTPSSDTAPRAGRPLQTAEQVRRFNRTFGEHSAAIYACAALICGDAAALVTEQSFVEFWRQGDGVGSASVRVHLLTIAHRLAVRVALLAVHDDDTLSDQVGAVVRRGQAIERTLACAHLDAAERSDAALVIHGRCTTREVARILDRPEGEVQEQLRAGMRHIRSMLAAGA